MTNLNRIAALLCTLLVVAAVTATAQSTLPLSTALEKLEKKHTVRFFYRYDWIKDIVVEASLLEKSPIDFLQNALSGKALRFVQYEEKYFILLPEGHQIQSAKVEAAHEDQPFKPDGSIYTIQGFIKEANTGEVVPGATVFVEEKNTGVTTNAQGFYSIRLPSEVYHLKISAVGKSVDEHTVRLDKNITLNAALFDKVTQLRDVEVSAEGFDRNIAAVEMSLIKMDIKTIKSLPAFLGEPDIIKSITLMPGVKTVGDGAGGFNVRGGAADQNLVLLDDVPIYNTSHLFGFFSAFNADAVKDIGLFKGGMPARYGGRVSSVLDVSLRNGNAKKLEAKGSLGIISSKLFMEGPIMKDKTTFLVGGRFAYPNWILHKAPDLDIRKSAANFYDVTGRLHHIFNQKNSISLTGYMSSDNFKLASDTTYGWTTRNASLKWSSVISSGVFLETTAFVSDYSYGIQGLDSSSPFKADFGIRTIGAKIDATYTTNINHTFNLGVSVNHYKFDTGKLKPGDGSTLNPVDLQNDQSIESAMYVSDEYKVNSKLTVYAGLRFSVFNNLGANDVYVYQEGVPKSGSTIIDTLHYGRGQTVHQYSGFEPRLSVKYSLTETSSIKASYNRNLQYLHLISNTTAISPIDLWKTSNYHLKPQTGQQIALGYFRNFSGNTFETSIEGYYKETENMLEYKDGANLFLNPLIESVVLPAFGRAYGIEFLVRKNAGKLTGWVGYTYSRTLRRVQPLQTGETVNKGKFYPSNYDKPHDLSVVMNYRFSRRLSMSANFTYNTGRPITYPDEVYIIDGYTFVQFSERNQGRIQDYHRLDLSFNLDESLRQTKRWKGSWSLSFFNVYARRNAYSVFFKPEYRGSQPQAYRLSVLGTIFPSLTYNFKID